MRPRAKSSSRRVGGLRALRFRLPAGGGQDGFTLIEIMASALIVAVIAVGVLGGLDATTRSSYETRLHTDAQALAQQDENRLRGLSMSELSNLNKNIGPITLDGTQFTVNETADYVSNSTQTESCTSPATDYVKTVSTVTWTNMGTNNPVTASSIVTPPVVSATSGTGGIAVQVTGTSVSGMPVSISGPSTGTVVTDSNGCALFGGLTPGNYTISLYSSGGTYVDMKTGATVTSSTPDTVSNYTVNAGVIGINSSFQVAPAGTLNYSFASNGNNPVGRAAGAIGVVAYNTTMNANNLRVCTLGNGTSCPAINNADTSFPSTDWPQVAGTTVVAATPLYPFNTTNNYTVYAGTCSANLPSTYSGTNVTATLQPSGSTAVTVTVPAMVIHVWNGTSSSPGSEILPSHVWIKDTGCNVRYQGYKLGTAAPAVSSGQSPEQAVVPVSSTYPTPTTGGVLAYPGMPYGTYNVCVDNGTSGTSKFWSVTNYTNSDTSLPINIYTGSGGSAQSGELGTC